MKEGFIGVIPARYGSTRFEGKPLVDIAGKSMIQRVYEQAKKAKTLEKVIVATDDKRIRNHVLAFGGEAMMTKSNHPSGTDRIAEVLKKLKQKAKVIINIQGDEPLINPKDIDALANLFIKDELVEIATLITPTANELELQNENTVKAIVNKNKEAIYFSRHTIPFFKALPNHIGSKKMVYYKHKGIYGYRADILKKISALKPCDLELAESLEQLRWIYNGYRIKTAISKHDSIGVDVPEDIKKILKILPKSKDK
jgi:3-deoxy-manno-octulosonate cytidylyltransferase (CMP-KDO synthetase)